MHAHLTLSEHGQFVGVRHDRLVVRQEGAVIGEYALNRLKSVQIAKTGVSFSSDAILQCAARGIKFFVLDFQGRAAACLSGTHQHAVVAVRQRQFAFLASEGGPELLAARVIYGKLRNQRATLLYFNKYHSGKTPGMESAAGEIERIADAVRKMEWAGRRKWRDVLLGMEGRAAKAYWQCLKEAGLLPESFQNRGGRGAQDSGNKALNYAYAVLSSYVWQCLVNAGLEIYAGFLHAERAGKPSLVLDMMEEYRAWTADRAVIKRRAALERESELSAETKKKIIAGVHGAFAAKHLYRGRKMRLESILQRQAYRLAGAFAGGGQYRPYLFKW